MIEVGALSKIYRDKKKGRFAAVDEVSFSCRPGEVYGLLGPNGAGKTTTLRMLSTAIKPTSGTARLADIDVVHHPSKVRSLIGFLSANTGLYGRLTPREVLRYFGRLFGMTEAKIKNRTEELADLFTMREFLERPCDKLSTGMKQKVNIARTVLHDPPVMIFDEPTSGLDVLTSRAIVSFIRRCRAEGKTVLFSTHIMAEVDQLCDHVGVIHKGRLHFDGPIGELRKHYGDNMSDAFVRIIGEDAEHDGLSAPPRGEGA
jgi:sodium transport system ATP-binding protein